MVEMCERLALFSGLTQEIDDEKVAYYVASQKLTNVLASVGTPGKLGQNLRLPRLTCCYLAEH